MIKIYELDNCQTSDRNGSYGGAAGSKEGILYNGEYWLVKYPQKTSSMKNVEISYTTAPLSEFIGSHIYDILGYDVHETILGIRNDKLVVACKDFCEKEGSLREIRTIKNIYNKTIEDELSLSDSLSSTGDKHSTNLKELLLHLEHNPELSSVEGIKERFWECSVIDAFISNNDRNNGNWGIIKTGEGNRLAPVFDNGASFNNKMSVEEMRSIMVDEKLLKQSAMSVRTAYALDGKPLFAKKFLSLDNPDLKQAIKTVVPVIRECIVDIKDMIMEIPAEYAGYTVITDIQKEFLVKSMQANLQYLLEPRYSELTNEISLDKSEVREAQDSKLYISLNKAFCRQMDDKFTPGKTFNIMTMPAGTNLNGKDIGGCTISPMYMDESKYNSNEMVATYYLKEDEPLMVKLTSKDGSYEKVDISELKDAIDAQQKAYREQQAERQTERTIDKSITNSKDKEAELE